MLTTAQRTVLVHTIAIVSTTLFTVAPARAAFDHLQCFKIKDNAAAATYVADIDPSDLTFAALPPSCTIKVPAKMLCVDAEKTNVSPTPPGADDGLTAQPYLCYKAKCTKVQPTVSFTDQFGVHSIQVKSTKMVCAPIPAPTTTTTMPACVDNDMDTFTDCAGDCNDSDASVNPNEVDTCNGVDDDCDGPTDEDDPSVGSVCNTGFPGACSMGTTICSGGALACQGGTTPGMNPESCNGLDDNCDGSTDEGNPGGGGVCATGLLGVCSAGTIACTGGTFTCVQNTSSSSEVCDGLDNDCNGVIDNGVCLMNGAACTMNSQCVNNQCVDGVCCNTACNSTCQACTTAKKGSGADGTCGSIANLTDPDGECAGSGTCNGMGACQP
jgi:hypothetical protein